MQLHRWLRSNWHLAILAIVLVAQLGIITGFMLVRGPGADEPLFAYVGWAWWEKGDLPYRDVFENKTPGIFLLYGLNHRLFGYDPRPLRFLGLLFAIATAACVGATSRTVFGPGVAPWAAGLSLLLLMRESAEGYAPASETFMVLPGALAWLAALHAVRSTRPWSAAAAGLLMALATCFKQIMPIEAAAILIVFGLWGGPQRLGKLLICLAAFVAPLLAVSAYFWAIGVFPEYLDAAWLCLHEAGTQPWSGGERLKAITRFVAWVRGDGLLPLVAAVTGAILALRRRADIRPRVLLAWAAAGCLGAFSSGWLWNHQFKQAVVALAPLAALGLWEVLRPQPDDARTQPALSRAPRILASTFIALALLTMPVSECQRLWEDIQNRGQWRARYDQLVPVIQTATKPQDRIYVYVRDESMYIFSDRLAAVRYVHDYFLRRPGVPEEVQARFAEKLPELLVLQRQRMKRARSFDVFLMDLAATRYELLAEAEHDPMGTVVYRLRKPVGVFP